MKKKIQSSVLIIVIVFVVFAGCKKETSCEGCVAENKKSPIAVAGPDKGIVLPTDNISLYGSCSNNSDGSSPRLNYDNTIGYPNELIIDTKNEQH